MLAASSAAKPTLLPLRLLVRRHPRKAQEAQEAQVLVAPNPLQLSCGTYPFMAPNNCSMGVVTFQTLKAEKSRGAELREMELDLSSNLQGGSYVAAFWAVKHTDPAPGPLK